MGIRNMDTSCIFVGKNTSSVTLYRIMHTTYIYIHYIIPKDRLENKINAIINILYKIYYLNILTTLF